MFLLPAKSSQWDDANVKTSFTSRSHCLFSVAPGSLVKKRKKIIKGRNVIIYLLFDFSVCVISSVSLQEEDGETERGCRGEMVMVSTVSLTCTLSVSVCHSPPVSLSQMTTFIMYSEGIISLSLPASLPASLSLACSSSSISS